MIETPNELRKAGLAALKKELGVAGMIRFLNQYDKCSGNYTEERYNQIEDLTIDEIVSTITKDEKS